MFRGYPFLLLFYNILNIHKSIINFILMPGQININTEFGKQISSICSNPKYNTFAEIGTWNGEGSTLCFIHGIVNQIKNNKNKRFYSVEANKNMYNKALTFYSSHPCPFLYLLYGKVNNSSIMTREEIITHPLFKTIDEHYYLHYDDEVNSFNNSPYIGDKIPTEVDVVLLDGGEFSTEGDWQFFQNKNVKVFMLDDVNVIKCNNIRKILLNDKNYRLLSENLNDRNGWSIFEKI